MDIIDLSLSETIAKLKRHEFSCEELVSAYIKRIEAVDTDIHALVSYTFDSAVETARYYDRNNTVSISGILTGIPCIIKDNISTAGIRTTACSKMLEKYIPFYDATVIEKIKKLGAVIIGKSNMDEFAMGSSTENSFFGKTLNPWNYGFVPGGSSGGSAAAVSSEECVFSLGSDTGGSIRQPTAFCGVVGLKPTYGRVSRYGLIAFASSLDQIGPITKTVEDSAIVLSCISGLDSHDSTTSNMPVCDFSAEISRSINGVKIGVPMEILNYDIDPEVKKALNKTINVLKKLKADVVNVSLPSLDSALSAYYIISSAEAASNLSRYDGIRYGFRAEKYDNLNDMYLSTRTEGFGSEVKRRIMLGNYVLSAGYYDEYYLKALKVRKVITEELIKIFADVEYLVMPVSPTNAFRLGEKEKPLDMYLADLFTVPVNIAGLPAISIPVEIASSGLPTGMQIIGKYFDEEGILRVGWNLERNLGFDSKPEFNQ